jgi:hypothetical protein
MLIGLVQPCFLEGGAGLVKNMAPWAMFLNSLLSVAAAAAALFFRLPLRCNLD